MKPSWVKPRPTKAQSQAIADLYETTSCYHCGGLNVQRGLQRMVSGMTHVILWCDDCGRLANAPGRPFQPRRDGDDSLPILVDYLDPNDHCEVCGRVGTELHHWAPKVVFGAEAETWPIGHLCPKCHEYWAAKIKAYFLSKMRRAG